MRCSCALPHQSSRRVHSAEARPACSSSSWGPAWAPQWRRQPNAVTAHVRHKPPRGHVASIESIGILMAAPGGEANANIKLTLSKCQPPGPSAKQAGVSPATTVAWWLSSMVTRARHLGGRSRWRTAADPLPWTASTLVCAALRPPCARDTARRTRPQVSGFRLAAAILGRAPGSRAVRQCWSLPACRRSLRGPSRSQTATDQIGMRGTRR